MVGRIVFFKVNILFVKENEPKGSIILRVTFLARSVVLWNSKAHALMDGTGRGDYISFYSFLALCQYTQEGMVWIFLSFPLSLQTECCWGSAESFWTLKESLGQILWPSFLLKARPEDRRNYSLKILVATLGLHVLLIIHHIHQAPVTHPPARVGMGPTG